MTARMSTSTTKETFSIPAVDEKRRRLLDNIHDWHSKQNPV